MQNSRVLVEVNSYAIWLAYIWCWLMASISILTRDVKDLESMSA